MLRHKIYTVLTKIIDKPAQNHNAEVDELVAEIRDFFASSPIHATENLTESGQEWAKNMNRLRELVLTRNPAEFLRWDVILFTMFYSGGRSVSLELNSLKKLQNWKTRWKDLIKEDRAGHPLPYLFYPDSSGNRIHHAYHLSNFEAATAIRPDEMDFIFEFGGGYGSLCRLIHKSGFKGRYLIYDLPAFSALQKFYLKLLGLPVLTFESFSKSTSGICCISKKEELTALTGTHLPENKKNLFIATWSLSESPLTVRDFIAGNLDGFNYMFLGFQNRFGEMENQPWFDQLRLSRRDFDWFQSTLPHLPGNNYLFGKVKSNR